MATSGILVTNFDISELFIDGSNNYFRTADYTNGSGSEAMLTAGMLVGRISDSGKITQCDPTADDGSQIPIGVLANNYTVANAATETLTFCCHGKVNASKLTYKSGDKDTVLSIVGADDNSPPAVVTIAVGTVEDALNRAGVYLVATSENTKVDNQ